MRLGLLPRTIGLFRRRKRHLLRGVFKKTVALAQQMGIVRLGLVALDSVKFPADASSGRKMTTAQLNEQTEKLDEYLGKVEASDQTEDGHYGSDTRGDELPRDLVGVQQRREKLEKALAILTEPQAAAKREPAKDVSLVDPEAPWVKKGGKFLRGYSGLEASKSKTDCLVPDSETAAALNNPKRRDGARAGYEVNRFVYDEANDEFTCPQGKKLVFITNHTKRGQAKIEIVRIVLFVPSVKTMRVDCAVLRDLKASLTRSCGLFG